MLQVPEHFLTGFVVPSPAIPAIAIAVIVAAVVYGIARAADRTPIAIAFGVALGGVVFLFLPILAGDDYVIARNLLGLWPAFAVGVALALGSGAINRLGTGVAVALCAAGLGITVWTAATPDAQRPDYRPLAEQLSEADEQRLIVSQTNFSSPLLRYIPGLSHATDEELTTSELVVVDPRPLEDYGLGLCWWIATCGGVDVEPPERFEPPPGFEETGTGSTELFDYTVYSSPEPITIERPQSYFTPRVFAQPAS